MPRESAYRHTPEIHLVASTRSGTHLTTDEWLPGSLEGLKQQAWGSRRKRTTETCSGSWGHLCSGPSTGLGTAAAAAGAQLWSALLREPLLALADPDQVEGQEPLGSRGWILAVREAGTSYHLLGRGLVKRVEWTELLRCLCWGHWKGRQRCREKQGGTSGWNGAHLML